MTCTIKGQTNPFWFCKPLFCQTLGVTYEIIQRSDFTFTNMSGNSMQKLLIYEPRQQMAKLKIDSGTDY